MVTPRMGHLLVEEIKENKQEEKSGFIMIDSSVKPRKGKVVGLPIEGNPHIDQDKHINDSIYGNIVYFMRCIPVQDYLLVNEVDVLASE
jgi:co-chaperonin GroES (HSP10)